MSKLSDSDIMPEALRLAQCRDVFPDRAKDVRFVGILVEVRRLFPTCPKCKGQIIRDCSACGGCGHVKSIDDDAVSTMSSDEMSWATKDDFIALVGDKQAGKWLWKEVAINGQVAMSCYQCETTGAQSDCKYCKGKGFWMRKPKELTSWCENNGFEAFLEPSSPAGDTNPVKEKKPRKKKGAM